MPYLRECVDKQVSAAKPKTSLMGKQVAAEPTEEEVEAGLSPIIAYLEEHLQTYAGKMYPECGALLLNSVWVGLLREYKVRWTPYVRACVAHAVILQTVRAAAADGRAAGKGHVHHWPLWEQGNAARPAPGRRRQAQHRGTHVHFILATRD